jgi:hypothetical protein
VEFRFESSTSETQFLNSVISIFNDSDEGVREVNSTASFTNSALAAGRLQGNIPKTTRSSAPM